MDARRFRYRLLVAFVLFALCLLPLYHRLGNDGWGAGGSTHRRGDAKAQILELEKLLERAWEVQAQKDEALQEKNLQLAEKDKLLQERNAQASQPMQEDDLLAQKDKLIQDKDHQLAEKEKLLQQRSSQCGSGKPQESNKEIEEKDRQLNDKEKQIKELAHRKGHFEYQYNTLFAEVKAGLRDDSLVMRHYLKDHTKELQATWESQTSAQRQRGIVLSAGGTYSTEITNAFVTLYVIRHHLHCSLPAAIIYWGEFAKDAISDELQKFFKDQLPDVEFINASSLPYPPYQRPLSPEKPDGSFSGWKVKVFSVYAAPFREVLFLDSDAQPLLDPTTLFDVDQYKQHGNLFWPDFHIGDVGMFSVTPMYSIFNLEHPWSSPDSQVPLADSGILMLDRLRNWEALEWILFANAHADVIYRTTYGDKDTFRLGFHLAGKADSFQQVAHAPAFLFSDWRWKSIIQFHPNGTVMFHHRTPTKYRHGAKSPLYPSTHVTARASPDFGTLIVNHYNLERALDDVDKQAIRVKLADCQFSLYDWPAAQHNCAPRYDEKKRGLDQQLPFFELPPGCHFETAEAVAESGFAKLENEGPKK